MADTVNLTLDTGAITVSVFLRGGIQATAGGTFDGLTDVIDGLLVEKGDGKTANTIEVTDRIMGWISATKFVAGLVNALPYTTDSNRSDALNTQLL